MRDFDNEHREQIKEAIKNLTFWQKLTLNLGRPVELGKFYPLGFKRETTFYAFKCRKHGLVTDYLHGSGNLRCPECMMENLR